MSRSETEVAVRQKVRALALSGAAVPEMLRAIQRELGSSRVTHHAIAILFDVFDRPLGELKMIGHWLGFAHGNPGIGDEAVEAQFGDWLRGAVRSDEDVSLRALRAAQRIGG